jgi:hypothetical protein
MLYTQSPDLPLIGIWLLVSLALSALGIRTIYRSENTYVKVI